MFVSDDSNWDPSKPEIQAAYKRVSEWFEEHTKSGKITGGEELKGTTTATTVRQRNGKVTVTDGPFAESKESIGGYALVDVKDLDEAIAMAKTWPTLSAIEIWPRSSCRTRSSPPSSTGRATGSPRTRAHGS